MGVAHYSDSMVARDHPGRINKDEQWKRLLSQPPRNRSDRRTVARMKRRKGQRRK